MPFFTNKSDPFLKLHLNLQFLFPPRSTAHTGPYLSSSLLPTQTTYHQHTCIYAVVVVVVVVGGSKVPHSAVCGAQNREALAPVVAMAARRECGGRHGNIARALPSPPPIFIIKVVGRAEWRMCAPRHDAMRRDATVAATTAINEKAKECTPERCCCWLWRMGTAATMVKK